jgi:ketosteroid isomerase-like protein
MRRGAVATLMVVIAVSSAGLWAQSVAPKYGSTDPAEEIKALEKAFDEAIVRRDVSALDKMTSDDFTLISLNGDLHAKAEVLKYFASHASEYEYRKTIVSPDVVYES